MYHHDFFTGGAPKKNIPIYHLTEPLVKFRRVMGKKVDQVDKYSTVKAMDPSKAAHKLAKGIAASIELENSKNIVGTMDVKFTMIERKPILNENGSKKYKVTHYTYIAYVTLNKNTKKIKKKNGTEKEIKKRYVIKVKQQNKDIKKNIKNVKVKKNMNAVVEAINKLSRTGNNLSKSLKKNKKNKKNNASARNNGNSVNRGNNASARNNGNSGNRGNNASVRNNGNASRKNNGSARNNGNASRKNNGSVRNNGNNGSKTNNGSARNNGNNASKINNSMNKGGYYYY